MNAAAVSALFAKAWSAGRQFEADETSGPKSAGDAYLIQDAVFAARYPGQRASVWKAGAAGPGSDPTSAPIGEARASPASFGADAFHMIGIEVEVAFRFGRDLPVREYSMADLVEAVSEAIVTIEVCDTRMSNWKAASPLWKLADFQLNGALVTGSGTRDWQAIDFGKQRAELWVNGRKISDRTGSHSLSSPFNVLPWAVAHCADRVGGLRKGDLVTTGSWTGMEFVAPGDAVLARFPGIGEAGVRIG